MKRVLAILAVLSAAVVAGLATAQPTSDKAKRPTSSTKAVWVNLKGHPQKGFFARFTDRDTMKKRACVKSARLPKDVPATTLPVDCTNNNSVVCPMDGNDQYGDCGFAMIAHSHGIYTYAQGKRTEDVIAESPLVAQYLQMSGGDNGSDEQMLVGPGGAWIVGVAGDKSAIVVDSLDIDVANTSLAQYAIDQFYTIQLAWSVPDAFLDSFTPGATYDVPALPEPANGHYTPLTNIAANGNYTLYTWGAYCFVTPAFVAAVQPQCFIVFSPAQFDPKTGYDSHGRHITTQATVWQSIGGNPIPASVINTFPPPNGPSPAPPTPTPGPTPDGSATITLTADQVQSIIDQAGALTLTPAQIQALQTLQGITLPAQKKAPAKKTSALAPPLPAALYPPGTTEERLEWQRRKIEELRAANPDAKGASASSGDKFHALVPGR